MTDERVEKVRKDLQAAHAHVMAQFGKEATAETEAQYPPLAAFDSLVRERGELRELVRRAAEVFDCHIDVPQACSHAELRDTAKEFRAYLEGTTT